MKNRITITIYGNEQMIGIHTKSVLNGNPYCGEDEKSKRLKSFEKRLSGLLGVQKADVRKFEVSIERGDAFDWNEIVPNVVPIVAKFCRYDIFELRIEDRRPTHHYDGDGYETSRRFNSPVDVGLTQNDPYAGSETRLVEDISLLKGVAA